ncbi:MAG: DNA photolyase [Armatimonadetes bacterium]|nr:DNA photolyase [Armatimonadota bacterium]
MHEDYRVRFERLQEGTLYPLLEPAEQDFIRNIAGEYRFTFQELRQVITASRDLSMWSEPCLEQWWPDQEAAVGLSGRPRKKELLRLLREHLQALRRGPKRYPPQPAPAPKRKPYRIQVTSTERQLFGRCPVYSEDTVCCGLRTLDAVARCAMGCSYCTIQTFYGEDVVIEADLGRHLADIELDPGRFYHIGTGQSSDSLLWGNRSSLLEALFGFADRHPNVLLELKTKSANVGYLLEHPVPPNLVCTWSLNTPTVIAHEEHHTARLEQRLKAAERVAARGIPVGFHLHPLIHYEGWQEEYAALAGMVLARFAPEQVLFLSLGTVTFIKPVLKEIRRRGMRTRVTQMELEPDPKGKLTYPAPVKQLLYRSVLQAFEAWQGRVFIYLCMEPAPVWQSAFGFSYPDSRAFQEAFAGYLQSRR